MNPAGPHTRATDPIERFVAIVGPRHAVTDPAELRPYLTEWRDLYVGRSPVVLRPGSTAEVAQILALASETSTPIVPQGGNTGLVGGQVPDGSGRQIVLSLTRLDRIRAVDPTGDTITAEAGVTLERVHRAAEEVGRLYPLTLGSQGTCTVGGTLSTNAGGTAVLAYGSARDLVLGLEVVLPTGEVIEGLRSLRKDNAGYDLKHLFLGTEGTLGIITAAVLKLFAAPKATAVALVGLASVDDALALLGSAKARAGGQLTAFEFMPRLMLDFALRHLPGVRDPLARHHAWYVLTEVSVGTSEDAARTILEDMLTECLEAGIVEDATIAESVGQARALWHMRHGFSEVQKPEGGSIKHDVSLPLAAIPAFLARAGAAVERIIPGARIVPFGHLGDGNIHYNISQPIGADKQAFLARWAEVNTAVHAVVADLCGSIAAEHGVGRLKRDLLPDVRSPVELALMRRLKATLDPAGILNPGKVLPNA